MTTDTAPSSLSERIADGIVDLIRADGLQPGDALSSSRMLATHFEVTVPTVRESLRRLEAMKVIQFRHGSGTYVGEGIGRRLVVNPHGGHLGVDPVLELIEARIVLEPPVAGQAATHRDQAHLAAIEAATANALVPQRADERPATHFHVALAAASGNALVAETLEALLHVRARDQVEIRRRYDDRERDHGEHVQILAAVRDGDVEAATDLTRSHLTSIRDALVAARDDEASS